MRTVTTKKSIRQKSDNQKLEFVAERSSINLIEIDSRKKITYINPQASTLFGVTVDELIGKSIYDYLGAHDRPSLDFRLREQERGIKFGPHRYQVRLVHGEYRTVTGNEFAVFDKDKCAGYLLTFDEITEEDFRGKESNLVTYVNHVLVTSGSFEESFRQIMKRLLQFFNFYRAVLFTVSPGKKTLKVHSTIGFNDVDMIRAGESIDLAEDASLEAATLAQGLIEEIEFQGDERNFLEKYVKVNLIQSRMLLPLEQGGNVLGVLAFFTRERNAFTEEYYRLVRSVSIQLTNALRTEIATTNLRESEHKYRDLFKSFEGLFSQSPQPSALYAPDGTLMDINLAATELLRIPEKEPIVGSFNVLKNRFVCDVLGQREYVNRAFLQGETVSIPIAEVDLQALNKFYSPSSPEEEGIFHIAGQLFPVKDDDGNILQIVWILHDYTERIRLQQQLFHAQKHETIATLVSGVTHELNNLLGPILGFAQILSLENLSDEDRQSVGVIETATRSAKQILSSLRAYVRPVTLETENLDAQELIEEILKLMNAQFRQKGITIEKNFAMGVPKIKANRTQLSQVFINILKNASDAFEVSGDTLRIATKYDYEALEISFTDNGPGFPKNSLLRIFDPFFTTKPGGKGLGLGLSTCLGIIQEHKGTIEAYNAPGGGAQFIIRLPASDRQLTPKEMPSTRIVRSFQSRVKILVIDDETRLLDVTSRMLTRAGAEVVTLSDPSKSVQTILDENPDLVITDIRMPQFDGFTLWDFIKNEKPELLRKILFITGDTGDERTMRFLNHPYKPHLLKPYSYEDLLLSCQRLLNARVKSSSSQYDI
ncbi:MAG: ATP-binding protein [Planctomycetes bacterium]|nr:ATP-binding protein [Planctomycetota bacterium]